MNESVRLRHGVFFAEENHTYVGLVRAVEENPCASTREASILCSIFAQTSPMSFSQARIVASDCDGELRDGVAHTMYFVEGRNTTVRERVRSSIFKHCI